MTKLDKLTRAACRASRNACWLTCWVLAAACADPEGAASQQAAAVGSTADFSAAGLQTQEVDSFLATLKQAVRDDDRVGVAALVAYPLKATVNGERMTIEDASAFTADYAALVTEPVKAAIAASAVENLFANYQGVRIGRGEVWFGGVYAEGSTDYVLMILAINPPR